MTQAKLGRFLIRDLNPWEGPGVFALTGDHSVMKYMGFAVHKSVGDATKLLQIYQNAPSRYQAVCLDGEPGDILGIAGVEISGHSATMTIMFRRDWKARGAGREFSKPFVQWIFTHPQIWRVWAYCHVDNIAVRRVLERMGAQCEGRLRRFEYFPNIDTLAPQDVYVYAIVRD